MRVTDVKDVPFAVEEGAGVRPLGALEHAFWLIDQERPMHFAVAAEIEGAPPLADWRKALDRVQLRHPMLSVRIERRHGDVPWLCSAHGRIPLRTVEAFDASWEAMVGQELATPFAPHAAPLVRAVLIRGDARSILILAAHHAVADGMSLAYLVRDILRALAAAPLEVLPMLSSQDGLLARANAQGRASDSGTLSGPPPGPVATFHRKDGAHPNVKGWRLDPELTQRIRDRARKEGASVHGAVCAAATAAGRQLSNDWREIPLRFLSPTNTRQILGVGEDCGLFVGAATIVSGVETAHFWDVARHATAAARAGKSLPSLQALMGVTQSFVAAQPDVQMACEFAASCFAREALVTNLGKLPIGTRYGRLELRALWGPMVLSGFVGDQSIGVSTLGGSLHLTHTSQMPLPGLLTSLQMALVDACAGA